MFCLFGQFGQLASWLSLYTKPPKCGGFRRLGPTVLGSEEAQQRRRTARLAPNVAASDLDELLPEGAPIIPSVACRTRKIMGFFILHQEALA